MAEPQESDDVLIQYFKDFLSDDKNTALIGCLRLADYHFFLGRGKTAAMFVHVTGSNAGSFASFKNATVECELYKSESDATKPVYLPFGAYFYHGYLTLHEYLEEPPKVPTSKNAQLALKDLLEFFSNTKDRNALTKQRKTTELEAALAVRITQNLLVPLAPHKTFVIDSYPGLRLNECCPDDLHTDGNKADTSFGCSKGWHGEVDILGDDIPLTVVDTTKDADELESVSVNSDSSIEVTKTDTFDLDNLSQITAHTIVYSFVHNKKNPKSPNSLVPGIGICAKKLVINLYDCVEDILVTTGPVDIYRDKFCNDFDEKAIIMLWLALNHGIFGTETPEKYQNYKARFHDVVGPEYLKAYRNESEQPFIAKRTLSMYFSELQMDAADGTISLDDDFIKRPHASVLL